MNLMFIVLLQDHNYHPHQNGGCIIKGLKMMKYDDLLTVKGTDIRLKRLMGMIISVLQIWLVALKTQIN